MAPLWCVSTTEDKDKANMAWTTVKGQTLQGPDLEGPLKPRTEAASSSTSEGMGKKAAKAKEPKAKERASKVVGKQPPPLEAQAEIVDEGTQKVIAIPAMVNSRPLNKGDELMVFKDKPKAKEREVQPLKVSSLAKKAKTKE